MNLDRLSINRVPYGKDKGRLKADVYVVGSSTFQPTMKIELPEELAVAIVRMAAPYLAASVRESLEDMAADAETVMLGAAVEAKAITSGE